MLAQQHQATLAKAKAQRQREREEEIARVAAQEAAAVAEATAPPPPPRERWTFSLCGSCAEQPGFAWYACVAPCFATAEISSYRSSGNPEAKADTCALMCNLATCWLCDDGLMASECERVREGGGTVAADAPDDAPDAPGATLEVVDGPRESARLEAGPRLIVHVRAESAGPSVAPFAVLAVVVALAVVVLLAQNFRR